MTERDIMSAVMLTDMAIERALFWISTWWWVPVGIATPLVTGLLLWRDICNRP